MDGTQKSSTEPPKPAHRVGKFPPPTTKKVTVTLDIEAYKWARAEALERHMSLSAVVSEAVTKIRQHRGLGELLAEMDRESPIPEDEKQRIDAEITAEWRAAGLIK